jgi:RNA polymerase sigma factor (sigma-70 family)
VFRKKSPSFVTKTFFFETNLINVAVLQKDDIEKEFERQIRENESLLHKVCRIYAVIEADRQDLFQEIVIQLWKAYPKFKGHSKFSTWLYRVAINTAITGLRKKNDAIVSYEPANLPSHVADENLNYEVEEKLEQLYVAVNALNDVDKAIVILYMEDRSYEEMEEILGITQGNLRVKMNRIKDRLRKLTKITDHGTR